MQSRSKLAVVLCASMACAPAPSTAPTPARAGPAAAARPAAGSHEVVFENLDGLVVVPVRLEGIDRPLQFVLDTGAPSVLSVAIAEELHLSGTRQLAASDAAGVDIAVESVTIPQLRIGSFAMKDVAAVVAPLPNFAILCHPIDGILGVGLAPGSGFLDRVALKIDYPRQRVVIAESGAFASEGGARLGLRRVHEEPDGRRIVGTSSEVEIVVEGKRGWASLDTGSRSIISVSASMFEKLGRSPSEDGLLARTGVVRETLSGLQYGVRREGRLRSMMMGGLELESIPVAIEDGGEADFAALLLGSEFLRNFTLVVDHPAGEARVILEPGLDPRRRKPELGFQWLEVEGKVEIVSLLVGGPAALAGLEIGDELVEISGSPLAVGDQTGQCEARRKIDAARDGAVGIRFRRDGRELTVTLHKAEPGPD